MRLLMNPIYAIVLFLFLLKISIYMTKIGNSNQISVLHDIKLSSFDHFYPILEEVELEQVLRDRSPKVAPLSNLLETWQDCSGKFSTLISGIGSPKVVF